MIITTIKYLFAAIALLLIIAGFTGKGIGACSIGKDRENSSCVEFVGYEKAQLTKEWFAHKIDLLNKARENKGF